MQINNITLISPGGNDTALVPNQNYDAGEKKLINDLIMKKFPNIEQVGFIDLTDKYRPNLQMAGGEFCGNATRSTAWLSLSGQSGEINVQVSGISCRLKAGVNKQGYAWVEMPVPDDINLKTIDKYTLVPLDGITQVISKETYDLTSSDDIKKRGMAILGRLNLVDNPQIPAAGVMFIDQSKDEIVAKPVVWVRDIQTCFYETACVSGTAAVGLYLAKQGGQKQATYSVLQPSGMSIIVTVDLTGKKPAVIISGPIKIIQQNATINTL